LGIAADMIPLIFDIVSSTAIFVLAVLGLGVIASMMGIFNFAHGEFLLIGAYTVYIAQANGLPTWMGMAAAPIVVGVVALALERTIIRRFYATPVAAMIGTFAIGLVLRESVRLLLGGQFYSVEAPLVGSFFVGDIAFSKWRVVIIVATILVLGASYLLLSRTRIGLYVRASLENPSLARASAISIDRVYAGTFAFGAALAGVAGGLMVPIYSLNADIGVPFLIKSFLAVMVGGIGSLEASAIGAAFVGAFAAGLPWAIKPVVADVLVFLLAIMFVKYRPNGLLSLWRR
jgi:branched-chain amino acid transport system permease protein